ncbi:hypothetical protein HY256_12135 [Candidatus Sumerlaeota bacterium]|nr:hypothetical protein [Candidatus Sumerlaeota bacterium]
MGADVNYFFECYALASVSAVYWASGAWEGISRLHPNHRAAAIGLVLIPLALGDALIGLSGIRRDLRNLRANWRPLPVAEFMTRVEGPVFVEQPFLALEKPAPPTLMDCAQFSILSSRGKLKEDQVIRMLAREEFRAIVVAANHVALSEPSWYSPKIKATLLAHYQISETLSGLTVFRPRGSPAAQ